jgi:hypothetical protein
MGAAMLVIAFAFGLLRDVRDARLTRLLPVVPA